MGLPQQNPEGYKQGSPITFASGLRGDRLLVHGSGDDNVHYQGTERLVNELVEKWKDSARTTNNAIVDLLGGDKAAEAPQPQSPQSVRYEGPHSGFGFPPGPPPSVPSLSTTLQRY